MTRGGSDPPDAPDGFLRDPIETYLRPVLQDLAQQSGEAPIPAALIRALSPRYTLTRRLGQGGMASVYLAFDQSLHRDVAIKVFQPEFADALTVERFHREIKVTAGLHHSRIVPVYDQGQSAGLLYYMMAHVPGGSLRNRLDEAGPLGIPEAIAIAKDVASALDYAHAHGVVHRDIKPENILLELEGACLADFGVARLIEAADRGKLTQTGMVIGTPYYMSPEQADPGAPVDGRSDIYALSCLVYEMLAGEPPFTGPDRRAVLAKHATAPVPDLTIVRDTVTPLMQAAIAKAMRKTAADRYATAGAFIKALEQAGSTNHPRRPRVTRRTFTVGVAAATIVVAALTIFAQHRPIVPTPLDRDKLVVAPLSIHDSSLTAWRMGVVDWLSRALDGAGTLRTVQPSVIARRIAGVPYGDPIELGRGLGAGLVVDGSLIRTGHDSLRLVLTLRDVAANRILNEVSASDQEARFDRLMDSATVGLLRSMHHAGAPGPLVYASIGSSSLPAIKAFLRGEELYRRLDLSGARLAYDEAVGQDSNFAPALLKLRQTMTYIAFSNLPQTEALLVRAIRHSSRLSARDKGLLIADSIEWFDPSSNSSVQRGLTILDGLAKRYEDDAEIWTQYGDAAVGSFYAWNPPRHYTLDDARNLFERAIALDSMNVEALGTSIYLSIALGDFPAARRRAGQCAATALPGLGRTMCTMFLAVLDRPNDTATVALLDSAPVWDQAQVLSAFMELPDSDETAVELAREMARHGPKSELSPTDFDMRMALAKALAGRGHLHEAWQVVSGDKIRNPGTWLPGQIAALAGWASDSMAALLRRSSELLTRPVAWGTAWWLAGGQDTITLRQAAHRLVDSSGYYPLVNVGGWFTTLARAHAALARHDTTSALRILLAMPDSLCYSCELYRFTTARLLAAAGRLQEAARWFSPTPSQSAMGPFAVMWRLERGRLAERTGNRSQAVDDFGYVLGMWQHADAELLPYVEESKRALQRLRSDR